METIDMPFTSLTDRDVKAVLKSSCVREGFVRENAVEYRRVWDPEHGLSQERVLRENLVSLLFYQSTRQPAL
jgi:hypothetical protein